MISNRRHRHLQLVPTTWAGGLVEPEVGGRAQGALAVVLRFLVLLGEHPRDVDELQAMVSAESERSWDGFQAAGAWALTLDDWIHGPFSYTQASTRLMAYLPIHHRTIQEAGNSSTTGAGRPVAMVTLVWTSQAGRWLVHGLTTL